jgi:hypothetical protein
MTDPSRWLDDAETSTELRKLLVSAERPHDLDEHTRSRLGGRVARLAVPISLATWLSVKSAAAIGVAAGLVTAGAGLGVSAYVERQARLNEQTALTTGSAARAIAATVPLASAPLDVPAPALEASAGPAPVSAVPLLPAPARSAGLAEESLLLERARSSLASAPAQSLALVQDHARRFPRGQLASERSLVELDALRRLGRTTEARALGQRLLAAGGDDLYRARIEGLLQKIDQGR